MPGCTHSVKYWFDQYVEHIVYELAQDPNVTIPAHVERYVEYMTFTLLAKKMHAVMSQCAENFARVRAGRPSVFNPDVEGFEEVAAFDLTSPGFPLLSKLGPQSRGRFVQSALNLDFVEHKMAKRLDFLQGKRCAELETFHPKTRCLPIDAAIVE